MRKIRINKTAFSLLELSIVLVIVSVLISGALSASIGGVNNAKIESTNERIKTIYEALGAYLVENGRLPCPAGVLRQISFASTAGQEEGTAGTCTHSGSGVYASATYTDIVYGTVPINELGLDNEFMQDAFGTKFSYFVDANFTSSSTFGSATSTSTITIEDKPGNYTYTVTDDAIFAIISHGPNQAGGYNINSQNQNERSSDSDEQDNDIGDSSTSTTGFDNVIVASSFDSDSFDDIVFFKTRNELVSDFNAFDLITCDSGTVTIDSTDYTMPTGYYNQNVSSTDQSCTTTYGPTYPQIRCGAFGNWDTWISVPCSY